MMRMLTMAAAGPAVFILAAWAPESPVWALAFAVLAFVAGYSTRNYTGLARAACWGVMWGAMAGALGIMAQVLMPSIEIYRAWQATRY